jgi:predicted ATPase
MRNTNWCVITGAPCSGKTTVIRALAQAGHPVVHEAARTAIDAEIAAGRDPEEIRRDPLAFQRRVLAAKLALEGRLQDAETVFIDRGIPDSVAYFQFSGLDPAEPLARSRLARYRRVFYFERLPLVPDKVRREPETAVARLDVLLRKAYRTLGYPIIPVPVLPVDARVDYILARL